MKAILEFDLPEDQEEHITAINGIHYKIAINNMDDYFRNRLKYEENLSVEARKTLQQSRDFLFSLTKDINQ